jgi:hypothetical protein
MGKGIGQARGMKGNRKGMKGGEERALTSFLKRNGQGSKGKRRIRGDGRVVKGGARVGVGIGEGKGKGKERAG